MADGDILQPGINIKPSISLDEIKPLVYDLYGFKVLKISELTGYDDKNYHVVLGNSDKKNPHVNKLNDEGYVVKIINSLDSKKTEFFDAQNAVLLHLGKTDILCCKPIPTTEGSYFTKTKLKSGEHIVRLLEFISGSILAKVTCTPKLFFQIGKWVGTLDKALQSFHHAGYDSHKSLWMLNAVPQLRQFIFAVKDESRKKIVLEVINEFESRVLPLLHLLEKGLIHGDVNEHNILVEKTDGKWNVKTIIDFGDSHLGYCLFELAITMTYMIVHSKDVNAGGYILAGYSRVRKVPKTEFNLLKICVLARLCQSLVLGAYSSLQNPDNSYVLKTSINGWIMLEAMWKEPDSELLQRWKTISENME
ncbi:hydroxylysine kinase [Anoplophora glabripennis]|uniref:hydroxylysine kinase n=1 Tax=Anoplophora glabripennis TaxID=217634 RepID=UPI0008752821|nr:hydroxylysine kinase [Anoplophora glabripennis]